MVDVFVLILVFLGMLCLWIILYDSNRFVVRNYQMESDKIRKNFRAVVLADLHNKSYGKDNAYLLQAIAESKPDMVLIAGDMITAKPGAKTDRVLQLLEKLSEDFPVYYGNGNHEHRLKLYSDTYGSMGEEYEKALEQMGIHPLVNERVRLEEYGVCIYGSQIDREYYKRFGTLDMKEDYLVQLLGVPEEASYNILLAHNPDYFSAYAKWGADLVLSGHVHGGIVRIPFWGKGVLSPNIRFFPKYDGGIFQENSCTMLESRGLGMHTIPLRMFNPAELLVVDFLNHSL